MDKSVTTNLIALLLAIMGFFMPSMAGDLITGIGVFALSGAVTNWLAIHMLFERVPGFYGSGVIPAHFSEFKSGIRQMIMEQFFNPENVRQFITLAEGEGKSALLDKVIAKVNFNKAFDGLIEVIMQSSFSGMLAMVGGANALQPLRDPFVAKMQDFLHSVGEDDEVLGELGLHNTDALLQHVEGIVDRRLEELTPELVKNIMQQMIRKHLGWLVVWGGVVGGLLGLLITLSGYL